MKNIKWVALLFLFNNEVVSLAALVVLAWAFLAWIVKEAANETSGTRS